MLYCSMQHCQCRTCHRNVVIKDARHLSRFTLLSVIPVDLRAFLFLGFDFDALVDASVLRMLGSASGIESVADAVKSTPSSGESIVLPSVWLDADDAISLPIAVICGLEALLDGGSSPYSKSDMFSIESTSTVG